MSIESILSTCNKQAMESLCKENYAECYRLLLKAEKIIESPEYTKDSRLSAITWNNLGCYYKRMNSFELAFEYLTKALTTDGLENSFLAEINLNILAVLQHQKKFDIALMHGIQAITLLKGSKRYITIIAALKNTAEVYLLLGKIEKALRMFGTCKKIAEKVLGADHELAFEIDEKIKSLRTVEKKFYFEKIQISENSRFPTSPRGIKNTENSRFVSTPKANEEFNKSFIPIHESKSLGRGSKIRRVLKIKKQSPLSPAKAVISRRKLLLSKAKSKSPSHFAVLEEKIKTIQSQLENFQVRYNELEQFTKANSPQNHSISKQESKTPEIKTFGTLKFSKNSTKVKLQRTLQEFEYLKKLAETENMFGDEMRLNLTSGKAEKKSFNKTTGFSTEKFSLNP